MLKIKDSVDLKELEKFGFEKFNNGCGTVGVYNKLERVSIVFIDKEGDTKKERHIYCGISHNTLFDLIQAGLVEKVEENE